MLSAGAAPGVCGICIFLSYVLYHTHSCVDGFSNQCRPPQHSVPPKPSQLMMENLWRLLETSKWGCCSLFLMIALLSVATTAILLWTWTGNGTLYSRQEHSSVPGWKKEKKLKVRVKSRAWVMKKKEGQEKKGFKVGQGIHKVLSLHFLTLIC